MLSSLILLRGTPFLLSIVKKGVVNMLEGLSLNVMVMNCRDLVSPLHSIRSDSLVVAV